jgi:hypothetical protein
MPGDTVLVLPGGSETLTRSDVWPELKVQVKGHDVLCSGLLLIREESRAVTAPPKPLSQDSALFKGAAVLDDDADGSRMDSIWELDMTSGRSVFAENDSEYSEESVLD